MKEKLKLYAAAPGEDASLKKGGIPKNYPSKQKSSKTGIKPLKLSDCSMENGSSDYISDVQMSRDENADALDEDMGNILSHGGIRRLDISSEDEKRKDYYDDVVREIQEGRHFGEEEEVDYTYDNLKEEIQCMEKYKPEEDIEYSYENTIKENQLPRCKHSSTVSGSYVASHST